MIQNNKQKCPAKHINSTLVIDSIMSNARLKLTTSNVFDINGEGWNSSEGARWLSG